MSDQCGQKPTNDFLPPTTEASTAVPAARSRIVIYHDDGDGDNDGDDGDDSDDDDGDDGDKA